MSFLRSVFVRIATATVVAAATLATAPAAVGHSGHDPDPEPVDGTPLFLAHDETLFESIAAPFACGTEWSGQTRPGHGQNDWNLDFNRTSLNYGENRQHDLGQPLFAQDAGTVTYIGWQVNAGTYLDIDYGDYGVRYIHLVDDSVVPELGATVAQGDTIALLGDTGNTPGFAHLHLEYWDSRGFDDARIWELKQAGMPQTEVTFDGNVIDPGEVVVSSNCVGEALAAGDADNAPTPDPDEPAPDPAPLPDDPLLLEAHALLSAEDPVAHLADRLAAIGAESLAGTTEAGDYALDEHLAAVVPGAAIPDEVVLVVVNHRGNAGCPDENPCPTAFRHGTPVATALDLLQTLVEDAPDRTVLVLFVADDDPPGTALSELLAPTDPIPLLDPLVAATAAVLRLDKLGDAATLRLRNDATVFGTGSFADPTTIPELGSATTLRWHRLSARPIADGTTTALRTLGLPTLEIVDLLGPCGGETSGLSEVNGARLGHQRDAAAQLVRWLGATTTDLTTTTSADRDALLAADLATFVELLRAAEPTGSDAVESVTARIASIDAILEVPVDDWTDDDRAEAENLLALFDNVLIDELCAAHSSPAPFIDVASTSFALADVGLLFDLGITTGTTPTTYSPLDSVTREQMAAFLARIWRVFHPDAAPTEVMAFNDVDADSFAFDDIRLLHELGITTGTSPTTYSPEDSVTREQMAAFLARVWRLLFPDLDSSTIDTHPFGDVDADSFAFDDVSLIFAIGVTVGTSSTTYSPEDSVTREQMAAFLARILRRHVADSAPPAPEEDPE